MLVDNVLLRWTMRLGNDSWTSEVDIALQWSCHQEGSLGQRIPAGEHWEHNFNRTGMLDLQIYIGVKQQVSRLMVLEETDMELVELSRTKEGEKRHCQLELVFYLTFVVLYNIIHSTSTDIHTIPILFNFRPSPFPLSPSRHTSPSTPQRPLRSSRR